MQPKSKVHSSVSLAVLLLLATVPAFAADAPSEQAELAEHAPSCVEPPVLIAERGCGSGVTAQPEGTAPEPQISAASTCQANCWDGSTVQCSGSYCEAVDSNCDLPISGIDGYCDGTDTGRKNCPTCPCEMTCPSGIKIACSGEVHDCRRVSGCYLLCDGVQEWCPNPEEPCPILY